MAHLNRRSLSVLVLTMLMLLVSGIVMCGWLLKVPLWTIFAGKAVMVFGVAAASFLAGWALWLRQRQTTARLQLSRAIGGAIAVFAVLVLMEHLTGWNLHIDLAPLHTWLGDLNPYPGRPAPTATVGLLILGLALALPDTVGVAQRLRHALAACVLMIGLVGWAADLFGMGTLLANAVSVKSAQLLPLMAKPTAMSLMLGGLVLLIQGSSASSANLPHVPVRGELSAYAFVGAAVTVLMTVALLSYNSITELQNRARQVDHSYLVRGAFDDALARYQAARGYWRRYLVRGDQSDFMALTPEVNRGLARFQEVLQLTQSDPAQQRLLREMKPTFEHDLDTMQQTAELKQQGRYPGESGGLTLLMQRPLRAEWLDARAHEFVRYEESVLAALKQSSQRSMGTSVLLVLAGNVVGFTILGIALWNLVSSLQQRARLEEKLRAVNETLETRIAERTNELSRANAELALLNGTLEQRIRERTADLEDFSYSVSHDLRAPLRAIDGYSMMLQEDQATRLDEEGRRMLGQIRHYGQRMGHLIDDLLRMSRLGRQSLNRSMLDMTRLAEEVRMECLADASKTGQKVAAIHIQALHSVFADTSLIRQVWINLISNALKYSSQVADPQVWITSLVAEAEVVYSIRDNGAGFDMAHADKLFGVFQRLHRNEEFTGTGVGLAIVDRIVRRHGGRVWAEGRPGQGATFHFTLPLTGSAHE